MWFADVNLPPALVQAHREDKLVLFVGAGASFAPPSSLPSFVGVVETVVTETGRDFQRGDIKSRPDYVLGRLESTGVKVHERVKKLITPDGSDPNAVHKAIIDLAVTSFTTRIVTTNWDRHLSTVLERRGWTGITYQGPALATGDDFSGLVYLHGSSDQSADNLVMTDRDFGRAYLTDAWAARFMWRLFSGFNVLFIGYSHDDVVMTYLAQGLRSGSPDRFVLTHQPERDQWDRLGIIPVEYAPAEKHAALPKAIASWAANAARKALDHVEHIANLVEKRPQLTSNDPDSVAPLTLEEFSYLEEVLTDPNRVWLFTLKADGEHWLRWALTQPVFRRIFTDDDLDDPCQRHLANWFMDRFVTPTDGAALALNIVQQQGGRLPPALWAAAAYQLEQLAPPYPEWADPWLVLLIRDAGQHDAMRLSYALDHLATDRPDSPIFAHLLGFLLRPNAILRPSFGFTARPRVDVQLAAEPDVGDVWHTRLRPALPANAIVFLDLAVGQIRRGYELLAAAGHTQEGWDPLSARRKTIEDSSDNYASDSIGLLITIARDSLEALLQHNPLSVSHHMQTWEVSGQRLLERLAIHAYIERGDLDADAKLSWLVSTEFIYDVSLRHETLRLIQATIGPASDQTAATLVERVVRWPDLEGEHGPRFRVQNIGDTLAWILKGRPDCPPAAAALAALHRDQDFTESDRPDRTPHVEGGFVEIVPSIPTEELHELVNRDALEAVQRLVNFTAERDWTFREQSPIEAVRALVATHPRDGVTLLRADHPQAREFTAAATEGWARATLTDTLANDAVATLSDGPLDTYAREIATLLTSNDRNPQSVTWAALPAARALARATWNTQDTGSEPGDLTLTDAVNDPAGRLAQFWIEATAHDFQRNRETWTGLTSELADTLNEMLDPDTPNAPARLAEIVVASQIRLLWDVDETWCRAHVLPLLSWDNPQRARATWTGYLTWGRPVDPILRAGLLTEYIRATSELPFGERESSSQQMADHIADICLNSSIDLVGEDPGFLTQWTNAASHELRAQWLHVFASAIIDAPAPYIQQLWTAWLHTYWQRRTDTVPKSLTLSEQSALCSCIPSLDAAISDAVELAIAVPAGLDTEHQLLQRINNDLIDARPAPIGRLVAHLLAGTTNVWQARPDQLKRIVQHLRPLAPDIARLIVERAVELGIPDALDW